MASMLPMDIGGLNCSAQSMLISAKKPVPTYEVVLELYLISLLCLVGLFGNVVSVVVLRRDKERCDALFLLQALAVADASYLVVALLRYPLRFLLGHPDIHTVMQPYVFPLLKTFQAVCIWMMVLVTVDRYVYVCKPLKAPQMFNLKSRHTMAVVVFVAGFVYNLPRWFDSYIMRIAHPCGDAILVRMVYRPAFSNSLYHDVYQSAFYIICLYLAPFTALIIMNFKLVQAIKHSRRRHREFRSSGNGPVENNATLVLIIIVLVFIVCETPELIIKVISTIERHTKSGNVFSTQAFRYPIILSEVLMVVNSSINFIIYVTFGRRFRHVMKETFKYRLSITSALTRESIPLQNNHYQPPPNHV